jgi:hypothetical protein
MHRALDHHSRSQFSNVLRQALNVDTLPEDLQNAADLVYDHCVICVKPSRPVLRPRVALPSNQQAECVRPWTTETFIIRLTVRLLGY